MTNVKTWIADCSENLAGEIASFSLEFFQRGFPKAKTKRMVTPEGLVSLESAVCAIGQGVVIFTPAEDALLQTLLCNGDLNAAEKRWQANTKTILDAWKRDRRRIALVPSSVLIASPDEVLDFAATHLNMKRTAIHTEPPSGKSAETFELGRLVAQQMVQRSLSMDAAQQELASASLVRPPDLDPSKAGTEFAGFHRQLREAKSRVALLEAEAALARQEASMQYSALQMYRLESQRIRADLTEKYSTLSEAYFLAQRTLQDAPSRLFGPMSRYSKFRNRGNRRRKPQ